MDGEVEVAQTPKEAKVTDADLNALREQIKQADDKRKTAEQQLARERELRQETTGKLNNEVSQRFSAQESAIENAIVAATAEIDGLEKQQTALMEEGKFAEVSKMNRLIADAQFKLRDAERCKKQLETYKSAAAVEAEKAKNDPLAGVPERSKKWIKEHPDFLNDPKYQARVMAAHNLCEADGVETESDEYFRRLDEAVAPKAQKITQQTEEPEDEVTEEAEIQPVVIKQPVAQTRTAPKSSTAAPVSRGGSGSGGGNSSNGSRGRIQLTPDQAEAALVSFPNMKKEDAYKRYYDNRQKLIQEGKIQA